MSIIKLHEFIKTEGKSYLDLGIQCKSTLKIQLGLKMAQATGNAIIGKQLDGEKDSFRFFNYNNKAYLDFGSGEGYNRIYGGTLSLNTYYDLEIGNRYVKDMSTESYFCSDSEVSFTDKTYNLEFANDSSCVGWLYYIKVYDSDVLILDGVPASFRDQTGIFDKINKRFIANKGEEQFILGDQTGIDNGFYYTYTVFETKEDTSLVGNIQVESGDWILATVTTRSDTTFPDGWIVLKNGEIFGSNSSNQRMSFLCKKADTDGEVSLTIQQTSSGRIYINLICIKEINGFMYHDGSESVASSTDSIVVQRPNYSYIIWGLSCPSWITSSPYGVWTASPNIGEVICLDQSTTQPRQANFIDNSTSESLTFTSPYGNDNILCADYVEIVTYTRKYLIKNDDIYYTVVDSALLEVSITELNAQAFNDYGADNLPDASLIMSLTHPKLLYWQDSDSDLPTISAKVTATPLGQYITKVIDLSDESITGINNVEVTCTGSPWFSCSFDGGTTWKEYSDGTWIEQQEYGMTEETIEAITTEEWSAITNGLSNFIMRVLLRSSTDKLTDLTVNFLNETET